MYNDDMMEHVANELAMRKEMREPRLGHRHSGAQRESAKAIPSCDDMN